MDVAIIIGVSKYSEIKDNLPGCKNDAEAIHKIIQKTTKFDAILYINEDETSAKTKELITNFVSEHKGKAIGELFFYYSGHGEFSNDEFYYILSDFDPKKRHQTSLQNTEVDDLIRTLSPGLVAKVIDACQSGTAYIKESNILNKYFTEKNKGFKKCYFLSSSLNNQSSYQTKEISHFTNSFIRAIKEHKTNEIRYKDIIDVIVDEFASNQEQTPFFITQAEYTEKFCTISKGLREYLDSFSQIKDSTETKDKTSSLIEMVKQDAKDYIDKEGAVRALNLISKEYLGFKLNSPLDELFKPNLTFLEDYEAIYGTGAIGSWIRKNKNEYFAFPLTETHYEEDGFEYEVTVGFDLKIDLPYKAISIDIISSFPNLTSYNSQIVFLLSKKSIRLFYFITNYIEESWDKKYLNASDIKWITVECKTTDNAEIMQKIEFINQGIQNKIEEALKERFKIASPAETTDTESKQQDTPN